MDIRTKLIFALLAVSLGSMFALGWVVSPRVDAYIRDGIVEQLDELAEAKRASLRWIFAGWRDGADLVASRTQLRASLDDYVRTGSIADRERIETILTDALGASRSATLLEVYASDGALVASVQRGTALPATGSRPPSGPPPGADAVYAGVAVGNSGPPQVTFQAPMLYEGGPIGTLLAVFEAPEVTDLTGRYHGLGETGETLLVVDDGAGGLETLHPTRHAPVGSRFAASSLGRRALAGDSLPLAEAEVDYRGEQVLASTRLVDETGWGLVVKMDEAEASRPIAEFDAWLRQTAIILSAFAIVLGLVLALRFALPIHALAEVANRIRHGEMDARANATREDEVGLLARTFNEMADELEARMSQLREFRRFFDVTIDLMCIAGTDGYFKLTNPAFERVLGWSEEELLKRPFFDFVHPDDMAATEHEVAKLAQGIPTISFQNRYLCKDGTYKLLRWTSYPEGDVLYAIAHVLDPAPTV